MGEVHVDGQGEVDRSAPTVDARARPRGGSGGTLLALVAGQVGLHACTQGMRLAAPLQALQHGADAAGVGALMALFALLPALLALPAGRMADRYGYPRPVRAAAALSIAGALAAAFFGGGSGAGLYAAAALCGAGSGFGMIAVQRTASRMARDGIDRIRIFSWVALAPAAAGFAGPLGAGLLIDRVGFRAAFLALALLPAATLLLAAAVPREAGAPGVVGPGSGAARPPAWQLLRSAGFRRLLFVNWLVATSWDVFGFALPIVGHARGISASALGSVLAAYAAASAGVRLAIPLLAHRLSRRLMVRGALALVAAVFVVFPWLHAVWAMAVGAALLGLALGAVQPAILASVHDVAPPGRTGEALALRAMSVHLSMTAMPLLFGAVGVAVGAAPLFWAMAAALAVGVWQSRDDPKLNG